MQARCLIKNAHLVSPGIDLVNASVEIIDGVIKAIHKTIPEGPFDGTVFDADGSLLVPGFIDIHTHGAAGHDFCDATPESLPAIARAKLKEGVTTFLPTTLTLSKELLENTFRAGQHYFENQCFAKVAGVHVEGPFINPKCAGAQNPIHVRAPDLNEINRLRELLPIKIVSLAVEMPGGIEFVEEQAAEHFIDRIVTADVFAHGDQVTCGVEEGRGVQSAGGLEGGLRRV